MAKWPGWLFRRVGSWLLAIFIAIRFVSSMRERGTSLLYRVNYYELCYFMEFLHQSQLDKMVTNLHALSFYTTDDRDTRDDRDFES